MDVHSRPWSDRRSSPSKHLGRLLLHQRISPRHSSEPNPCSQVPLHTPPQASDGRSVGLCGTGDTAKVSTTGCPNRRHGKCVHCTNTQTFVKKASCMLSSFLSVKRFQRAARPRAVRAAASRHFNASLFCTTVPCKILSSRPMKTLSTTHIHRRAVRMLPVLILPGY